MLVNCANMCVNELLWMLSWGWHQLAFGVIFSWLLYVFVGRMRMIPALVLVCGAYGFALCVYFSFVGGIIVNHFQWPLAKHDALAVFSTLHASLVLGAIYTILQLIFYAIINYVRPFPVLKFFILSGIANTLAAFVASYFIKIIL